MGLLTNPNTEDTHKWISFLNKHGTKVGFIAYLIGLVWLGLLANVEYNLKTYFSENALLPGLVVENFGGGHRADNYLSELLERKDNVTAEYVVELFKRVGLQEVEMQHFTLVDPITKKQGGEGTNVFAVFRAKRAAGTESLVFNAPYFPKHGESRKNLASIALMLALAEYFQNQVYWAKDIVFLVAEGHLGTLAWVKGHQEMFESTDNLKFDRVVTKAGNIQAAVNMVMEGNYVCGLETKFHGINGQLPNLDFVNLLNKFIVSDSEKRPDWEKDVWKLVNYMQTQATGTPTGSHGFFLKYGIESVTMTGKSTKSCKPRGGFTFGDLGRILEAVFRSLNNLLERLHQSFFFYLKTTPNRFISISLYYPPLALIILPILLKGAKIWLTKPDLAATQGLFFLMGIHSMAVFLRWSLSNLDKLLDLLQLQNTVDITPETFLIVVLGFVAFQILFTVLLLQSASDNLIDAVYCFILCEFSTFLYSLALFNPSLVVITATFAAPFLTLLFKFDPKKRLWLGVLLISIAVGTIVNFCNNLSTPVNKYFYEAEVYGNFLFDFIFLLGLPVVSTVVAIV